MKELYRFRQYLTEGVIKEAYNLPDSDSTTDKYVNNHWDGILKDILRAHTDLRNSKGGENIPERPSQLDIDIVLGRFDGAGEFMDVDPNEYNEYFDFYDMYLVTQRDEENTKDISVEDYPEGDYSGYTKRDDLPKLDEGVIKEDITKLRGQELLDLFNFTKYMNVDVEELESEFEDAINYGQFTDPANFEEDKKDFTYENGDRFLDTNEDKMSEYLGFEIDTEQMIDDYFLGEPKAVEFVHSDEDFEGWMDEIGSFWS